MNNLSWFWLSFADKNGPKGVCIVDASSLDEAVRLTWRLGINPGGDIVAAIIDDDTRAKYGPPFYRLMLPDEVLAMGASLTRKARE